MTLVPVQGGSGNFWSCITRLATTITCHQPTMELLRLGDDVIEAVLLSAGTTVLGAVACTCKQMQQALAAPAFLRRLTAARGFASGPADAADARNTSQFELSSNTVDSLETLAVLEEMRSDYLGENHIGFHLASLTMTRSSKSLLRRFAEMLRRHPNLRIRIDSHTGVGAPPQIHGSHSVQRAAVVAEWLAGHGVAAERISACAWGYRVGQHRDWPAAAEFARAELFVAFGLPDAAARAAAAAGSGSGDDKDAAGGVVAEARTDLFDRARCLPAWPSYFESVEPVKDLISFDADGCVYQSGWRWRYCLSHSDRSMQSHLGLYAGRRPVARGCWPTRTTATRTRTAVAVACQRC